MNSGAGWFQIRFLKISGSNELSEYKEISKYPHG